MVDRRRPRLSLDLLRGFCAAARHLNFTRAADELSVTQSAISREVKTLEAQIGEPLFHREHRALQLTRAGEELYRAADEALTLVDGVTERLTGAATTLRFPQYDQLVAAAVEGSGVAMGVLPHLAQQLRDRVLCAPFGDGARAKRGAFFVTVRRDIAGREAVKGFVDWLRSEARRDGELAAGTAQVPGAGRLRSSRPRPRAAPRARGGR